MKNNFFFYARQQGLLYIGWLTVKIGYFGT